MDPFSSYFPMYSFKKPSHQEDLIEACRKGDKQLVVKLLSRGADINQENELSDNAFRCAACHGHAGLVKYLVTAGAYINDQNAYNGRTALICAAILNRETVVDVLIDLGANMNLRDKHGKCALFWAAERNHEDVAFLLLKNGADVNVANDEGQTPAYVATKNEHYSMVNLLVDHGGLNFLVSTLGRKPAGDAKHEGISKSIQSQSTLERELKEVKTRLEKKDSEDKVLKNKMFGVDYQIWLLQKASKDQKLRELEIEAKINKSESVVKPSEIESILKQLSELRNQNTELLQRVDQLTNEKRRNDSETQRLTNERGKTINEMAVDQRKKETQLLQLTNRLERIESEETNRKERFESLRLQVQRVNGTLPKEKLEYLLTETSSIKERINHLESADIFEFEEKFVNLKAKIDSIEKDVFNLKMSVTHHVANFAKEISELKPDERVSVQLDSYEDELARAIANDIGVSALEKSEVYEEEKKNNKSNRRMELNEFEQERLLDTIEISGIQQTDGEILQSHLLSLSRILGTAMAGVKKVERSTRHALQVQFDSVESARSWLDAFEGKRGLGILASDLSRSLNNERIRIKQKLTPYNRDLHNCVSKKWNKEKTFRFWLQDGKIFLRKNGQKQVIRIKSVDDIPT